MMPTANDASATPLDLSACAREPIHIPGAIQPYGLLLVIDPATMTIVQRAIARQGVLDALGDPRGQSLDAVFGGRLAPWHASLQQAVAPAPTYLGHVELDAFGVHHGIAHRSNEQIILELEEAVANEPGSLEELYPMIRAFVTDIESAADTAALCQLAATQVRQITGFDRVMVYQFDSTWNGIVVAEDRNDVLPSYLDLRFPESDIPAQARELYRRNRLRLIADCNYTPVPIEPRVDASASPDLSLSVLRSVSPVHLQYMRNMDTHASMSISLLREGKLWGLISCHNQVARRVPYHVRTACEFMGQILSLQIAARAHAHAIEQRVARRAIQVHLLSLMAGDEDFLKGLSRDPHRLLSLVEASGAAIVHRGQCIRIGDTPDDEQVAQLVRWLSSHVSGDEFHTDSLARRWPDALEMKDAASGVLAISISQLHDSFLLWFRPEVVRTVRWGGEPAKEAINGQLSPRTSFEAWKETVLEQSIPWSQADVEAAMELRTAIVDIVLRKAEEMAELNEQLLRSNKELEAFSYSVSHDLRAPFRHIVGYSELLVQSAGDKLSDKERRFVATIVESAKSAGTLVDDLLSFSQMGRSTMGRSTVDMGLLAADTQRQLEMEAGGRAIEWRIGELPVVRADPSMLRLVLQNLFSNAIKFTRDSAHPRIELTCETIDDAHVFHVRDNGCGFDMRYVDKLFGVFQRLHHADEYEGTGIGLANVRRIVERHGGHTWANGQLGEGATISFTLPHSNETHT